MPKRMLKWHGRRQRRYKSDQRRGLAAGAAVRGIERARGVPHDIKVKGSVERDEIRGTRQSCICRSNNLFALCILCAKKLVKSGDCGNADYKHVSWGHLNSAEPLTY